MVVVVPDYIKGMNLPPQNKLIIYIYIDNLYVILYTKYIIYMLYYT